MAPIFAQQPTADDMTQQARMLLASQSDRLPAPAPIAAPVFANPQMPDDVQAYPNEGGPGEMVMNAIHSLFTLPQRAIQNSQQSLDSGNYDPSVPVEAALTTMGGAGAFPAEANTLRSGASLIKSGMPEKSIFDKIAEKYPDLKIDGSPARTPNDYATLGRIQVPQDLRGKGLATDAMNDLIAEADKQGTNLALSPTGEWGASPSRLQEFYSRFGFVPNKGRNKDFATRETMIRAPKKDDGK